MIEKIGDELRGWNTPGTVMRRWRGGRGERDWEVRDRKGGEEVLGM